MSHISTIVSSIGVVSSIVSFSANTYMLVKAERRKNDMTLFYFRFLLDVILSVLVAVFLICGIFYSLFPEPLPLLQTLIFYLSLPASNIYAVRSILILFISVERVIAVYFPIFFYKFHTFCPRFVIIIVAIIYGLTEDIVLYVFCDFQLTIPENCTALGCAINSCFYRYWTTHKSIVFALIFLFAFFLCSKLFMLNKSEKKERNEQPRINRLAMIDAANVLLSEFLPIFAANQLAQAGFFNFQTLGSYEVVAKKFGCAVEAMLVLYILSYKRQSKDAIDSKFPVTKSTFITVT